MRKKVNGLLCQYWKPTPINGDTLGALFQRGSAAGVAVDEYAIIGLPAFYRATQILGGVVASIPFDVIEKLDNGGTRIATEHPNYKVISRESITSSMVHSACAPMPCWPDTAPVVVRFSGSSSTPELPSHSGPTMVTPARSGSQSRMRNSLVSSLPSRVPGGPKIQVPCSALGVSRKPSACWLLKWWPVSIRRKRPKTSSPQ